MNSYLRFSVLAIQMALVIGLFAYLGYHLDEKFSKSTGLFFIIFSLLGVFISFYLLYKEVRNLK